MQIRGIQDIFYWRPSTLPTSWISWSWCLWETTSFHPLVCLFQNLPSWWVPTPLVPDFPVFCCFYANKFDRKKSSSGLTLLFWWVPSFCGLAPGYEYLLLARGSQPASLGLLWRRSFPLSPISFPLSAGKAGQGDGSFCRFINHWCALCLYSWPIWFRGTHLSSWGYSA